MKRIFLLVLILLLPSMCFGQTWDNGWSANATKINGGLVPTSQGVVGTNSSGQIVAGTVPASGGFVGIISSPSGPVTVLAANNNKLYSATGALSNSLPTGDLSAYVGASTPPLVYWFSRDFSGAGNLDVNPGSGNFCGAGSTAGQVLRNSTAEQGDLMGIILVSSVASVNRWNLLGGQGTWNPTTP